jgi:hypothetical protein
MSTNLYSRDPNNAPSHALRGVALKPTTTMNNKQRCKG